MKSVYLKKLVVVKCISFLLAISFLLLTLNPSLQLFVSAYSINKFYVYNATGNNYKVFSEFSGGSGTPIECLFVSTRPSISQRLNIVAGTSNYCFGDVSSGSTAMYLPSTKVVLKNARGATFEKTNPTTYTGAPSIYQTLINGTNTNSITVNEGDSVEVILQIRDTVPNKSCNITNTSGVRTETKIDSCLFRISNLSSNVTYSASSKNIFDISSNTLNFTITVIKKPTSTPIPTDSQPSVAPTQQSTPVVTQPAVPTQSIALIQESTPVVTQSLVPTPVMSVENDSPTDSLISFVKTYSATEGKIVLPEFTDTSNSFVDFSLSNLFILLSFGFGGATLISSAYLLKKKFIFKNKLLKFSPLLFVFALGLSMFLYVDSTNRSIENFTYGKPKYLFENNTFSRKPLDNVPSSEFTSSVTGSIGSKLDSLVDSFEKIMLQTRLANTSDGEIWATEANLDPNTNFAKLFKVNINNTNGDNWKIEYSNSPIPEISCGSKLNKISDFTFVPKGSNESIFSLEFSKIIPKNLLNGKYNGTLKYYLRLVKEKSPCDYEYVSNNVLIKIVSEKVLENFVPDAQKIILFSSFNSTKGTTEFPEIYDNIFIDRDQKNKNVYFFFDGINSIPKYGRWQISTSPFNPKSCFSTSNILSFQDIDVPQNINSAVFSINIAKVLDEHPVIKNIDFVNKLDPLSKISLSLHKFISPANYYNKIDELSDQNLYEKKNIILYVRFVAMNPEDGGCNALYFPSSSVKVEYGKKESKPVQIAKTEYHSIETKSNLDIVNVEFVPIYFQTEFFNPVGHYIYTQTVADSQGNVLIKEGDKFYIPAEKAKDDKTFSEYVFGAFDSIVSFVKGVIKVINYVADTYNSLKDISVNLLASGISAIGIPCDAECKVVLSAGFSIAQSAIGLPPTLPNFEQMLDGGIDYLAKEIAEQALDATGVPLSDVVVEDLAKKALVDMKNNIKEGFKETTKNNSLYYRPDPDYMYKPARMIVTVKNNSQEESGGYLKIDFVDSNFLPDTDLKIRNMFKPVGLNIPRIKPGEELKIPVNLEENYFDYRSFKGDVPTDYICNTSDGSCAGLIENQTYALNIRKSRFEKVYKNMPVQMTLQIYGQNKLANFDPKKYGFDTSNWESKGNQFGKSVWFDKKNNVEHVFTASASIKDKINENRIWVLNWSLKNK